MVWLDVLEKEDVNMGDNRYRGSEDRPMIVCNKCEGLTALPLPGEITRVRIGMSGGYFDVKSMVCRHCKTTMVLRPVVRVYLDGREEWYRALENVADGHLNDFGCTPHREAIRRQPREIDKYIIFPDGEKVLVTSTLSDVYLSEGPPDLRWLEGAGTRPKD